MSRKLIDAEKLKKHYAWWEDDERRTLFDQIVDAQPTVDAVPVIRCKDCKNWEADEDERCMCCGEGVLPKTEACMGYGFCSMAEPKDTTEEVRKQLKDMEQRREMDRKK